jgi:hypothetical protein
MLIFGFGVFRKYIFVDFRENSDWLGENSDWLGENYLGK